ncbi:MAK10-like protein [Tanacetum coccineum]
MARKNELKAKSTQLLAILDEHLLKFHGIKDAKTLWEAIKTRSEGLDRTYDRFQKLIIQLEIHGEVISQEDANLKLLISLPSAWNNIALIMRNKSDLDTLSMDDLYNNLKVYEAEIKGQSSSSLNSQNVAFVSLENTSNYSKPSHEGYRNTIELPKGKNVVPLRSDTIQLVQNGCSFHRLRSEDPNQHLKDFLKLVDLLDLNGDNRERTRLRLFQSSFRDQASDWLEHLLAGSITAWDDLTTLFLTQFFLPGRTAKLNNVILIRTIDQSAGGKLHDKNAEESWALLEDLALYDNESWNDPRDFAKLVKGISLPKDVPSTFDRHLIELENQVQHLMEAHLAPKQPIQVNKITSSCEICSGLHDTRYYMKNTEQAFVEYASSRTNKAGDARLSKFEADFKQQQSEMNNKIDIVLNAITDRIAGALPSNMVKIPKLNVNSTSLVLKPEEDPENSNATERKKEQRGTLQPELKDPTNIERIGPSRNDKEREIKWSDVKEPLDLVDISEEREIE